jgi:hypothetical protein
MLQLFRVLNKLFDKHKESRRRHLAIHTPIIIPVWSQVSTLPLILIVFLFETLASSSQMPLTHQFFFI